MPKELTHWIIAAHALDRLSPDNPLGETIRSHRELYLAGAVLPDTLLHLVRGPWSKQALALAHRFHDPEGNSYAPLIRALELHSSPLPPPLLACLMGVLCHMQADITLHPFVYDRSGTMDLADHYRLETAIDVHFLANGIVPPVQLLNQLVTPDTRQTLLTACSLIFDPDHTLPPEAIEKALDLHSRFQALYDSLFWKIVARLLGRLGIGRLGRQQHLFYPLFLRDEDPVLLEGIWQHPVTRDLREESVDHLAETAVCRTVQILGKLAGDGLRGTAMISGENLLTGLYGIQQKRMLSG